MTLFFCPLYPVNDYNEFLMSTFHYKATNVDGEVMEGMMEAAQEGLVVKKLQELGYIPIRVEAVDEKREVSQNNTSFLRFSVVSRQEVLTMTQELSGLLKAGLSIDRALKILLGMSDENKSIGFFRSVYDDVVEGSSLADAMAKHPKVFSRLYVSMVRSGESSGTLDLVFERLTVFLERSQELRGYVLSSMIYPLILLFVSVLSIVILLVFVIPKFASMFSGMGVTLPFMTELLLTISRIVQDYWWGGIFSLLFISFIFRYYIRSEDGGLVWDRFRLRFPLLGPLNQRIEMARFTRTLGTILKGGVPILQALNIAKEVVSNRVISDTIQETHARVKRGERIGTSLRGKEEIPPMVTEMITVGEETGRLYEMLLEVAEILDKQIRERVKRLLALVEPGLILTMGLIVGAIVVSMLMAIFSINEIPF